MRMKLMVPAALGASIAVGAAALGAGADSGSPTLDRAGSSSRFIGVDDRVGEKHAPPGWDKDVADVMRKVHDAVAAKAPEITGPIIDKAETDGKITSSQADRLRDAAKSLGAGPPGGPRPDKLGLQDEDVRGGRRGPEGGRPARAGDRGADPRRVSEGEEDQLR